MQTIDGKKRNNPLWVVFIKKDQLKTKASFNLVLTYHKLVEAEAVQLQDTIRKAIILMKYINPAISRS